MKLKFIHTAKFNETMNKDNSITLKLIQKQSI